MKRNIFLLVLFLLLFSVLSFAVLGFSAYVTDKKIEDVRVIKHQSLQGFKEKIILIYFGYVGCEKICHPLLVNLSKMYESLDKNRENIAVFFVNIAEDNNGYVYTKAYIETINPAFRALKVEPSLRRSLYKEFDVYFARSLFDETTYDHTSYVYMLSNSSGEVKLLNIHNGIPLDTDVLKSDIKRFLEN